MFLPGRHREKLSLSEKGRCYVKDLPIIARIGWSRTQYRVRFRLRPHQACPEMLRLKVDLDEPSADASS